MNSPSHAGKPRLVVPYGRMTLSPMTLAQAASGLCELLWLVNLSEPEAAEAERIMKRLGIVVNVDGVAPEDWAAVVEPYRPTGIVSFSDANMPELAELSDALGLHFHSPEVVARFRDKSEQRAAFRAAGLPTPQLLVIPAGVTEAEVRRIVAGASYPAVLKPRYGNDSRLVSLVDGPDTLLELLGQLTAEPEPWDMVLEDYLGDIAPCLGEGFANYLSVESFTVGGAISHFATTGRFPPAEPFRETGFFIPSSVEGADAETVQALATAALSALGVTTGCTHTEIKFTPAGPRVIEVNGRLGGGIPLMFELSTGASAIRLAMEIAVGVTPSPLPEPSRDALGFRFMFQGPTWAREVTAVKGLDKVGAMPEVRLVVLHRPPGTPIDWRIGNHDYVFAVAGIAAGYDDVRRIQRVIDETVTVSYAG